ncbi:hypothetical protein KPGFFKBI_00077 [[Clostridium] scindens]|uniref:hypothetical protein n=1 Tax=Clostridium scindens (strain JCM 10418 / VPI 12708) TaxID=29347 RepID=UPI00298C490E|nr:hypothetical protein [[Clostridium] scindens]WPB46185.1 hypothetical protein KPGFFKBI_00077 [[Clostridium] scindens]
MKAIFNDATDMQIQQYFVSGGMLHIKTISATREELRGKFSDEFACKEITIEERGQKIDGCSGYTELYRIEEYTGGILGVVMCRIGQTPEERLDGMDTRVKSVEETLDIIVKGESDNDYA